jgi:hypothetical protein
MGRLSGLFRRLFYRQNPPGRLQLSRNPEEYLEGFLAPLPAWLQRTLVEGFPSLTQAEILEWAKNSDEVFRLTPEYEAILQLIPLMWTKYRERLKGEAKQSANYESQLLVPKGKPGAPRKDERAQEAALLQRSGMKIPQITAELNRKLPEDSKTTSEAVRKLLKRRSRPDKI